MKSAGIEELVSLKIPQPIELMREPSRKVVERYHEVRLAWDRYVSSVIDESSTGDMARFNKRPPKLDY